MSKSNSQQSSRFSGEGIAIVAVGATLLGVVLFGIVTLSDGIGSLSERIEKVDGVDGSINKLREQINSVERLISNEDRIAALEWRISELERLVVGEQRQ